MKDYKVGVLQFAPKFLDLKSNFKKIQKMTRKCNLDLLVLPELASSGYAFTTKDELLLASENAFTGPSAIFFMKLSRELNCSIISGFAQKNNKKIYNSCMLVNPDGKIRIYQKTHLFGREKLWFTKGESGFFVCEAKKGVLIGMMICFDWFFPESSRTLALLGAEIICQPANLVLPWCQKAMITRSLENRTFSITANRVGTEKNGNISYSFTGGSQVVDYQGQQLCKLESEGEKLLECKINLEETSKSINKYNNIFEDRRKKFYL